MKKSPVYIFLLLVCVVIFFLSGCARLKQGQTSLESRGGERVSSKTSDPEASNQTTSEDLSANYFFLESRFHIKNKDYPKAIDSLEKALAKDPGSFILTRDLVKLFIEQNNGDQALALAEKLIRINPDNVDGLLLLVQLKKDAIDEKELVDILNRVLVLDPENKETFLRLGKIYIEKENNTQALNLFRKMVDQFPDYYVAWFYLGEVYLAEKQYDQAIRHFLKTIDLEPDLVEPRFQLIKIYLAQDLPENNSKILELYSNILEIEPDNQRAFLGKALHLYKTGNKEEGVRIFMGLGQDVDSDSRLVMVAFDEYISAKNYSDAVIVFSEMLKADPENSTLNFFTGMAYEALEDFEQAISFYLKIKPEHSQYKKTILSIALLYKQLGEKQTAINHLEDKVKLFPKDIDIITYLASFYENDKLYDKAIRLLKNGLEDSPDNTSLLFRLGAIQDKAGLRDECIENMKKIINIDPKDAGALNYLGYSYADMGIRLDEALELIKRAVEIRPDDGYIIDSLGWVYYKMEDFDKAVEFLEQAAKLTEYDTIISDHLGDAYQKANQLNKALDAYQKALDNAGEEHQDKIPELQKKIEAVQKTLDE